MLTWQMWQVFCLTFRATAENAVCSAIRWFMREKVGRLRRGLHPRRAVQALVAMEQQQQQATSLAAVPWGYQSNLPSAKNGLNTTRLQKKLVCGPYTAVVCLPITRRPLISAPIMRIGLHNTRIDINLLCIYIKFGYRMSATGRFTEHPESV